MTDSPSISAPKASEANPRDGQTLRILVGLGVGVVGGYLAYLLGQLVPSTRPALVWTTEEILQPFGQIFLRLLFFIVVPLVFSSLAFGIAQLRDLTRLRPLALRTFALFGLNMAVGVTLGLTMMNVLQPGGSISPEVKEDLLAQAERAAAAYQEQAATQPVEVSDQLNFIQAVKMFLPRNLLLAVVNFQLLPLIVFGLLTGAAVTRLAPVQRDWFETGLQSVVGISVHIVDWAMRLAPYAVAALIASVMITAGLEFVQRLLLFVGGVLLVMSIHLLGTMSLLLRLFSKRPIGAFFRAIRIILATAFSTSSSNATLPTSMRVSREVLGVSHATAGFVLPLGATLNMSGTALYEGCVVIFVAQIYGFDLSLAQQIQLVLLAVFSAVAVAGIPGGSIPVLMGLLYNFGLPPEGIGLILGFDRLLDMARTTVNVGADVVTASIVDDHLPKNVAPVPPA